MRSTSLHVTIVCITMVDSDWWILISIVPVKKLYAIYNSSDFIVTQTTIHLIITIPTTMNYKSILKQGNEYLESLTTLFSLISSISRWALHQVNETNNIREIKHRVHGKRERQKYHVITSFPPFSRLPFAVFNVKRPVLAFINNASTSLKFFIRFATIFSLCLSPVMFYLFFYANWPVYCQCSHKREEKSVQESELMFGCQLRKGYQLFYEKGVQIMQYVKHPKETTFNR